MGGSRQHNAARDLNRLDIRLPQPKLHTDIPRLRAGGVGGRDSGRSTSRPARRTGHHARPRSNRSTSFIGWCASIPTRSSWRNRAVDVKRIFKAGRIASLIGMEGGHSIDNSLGVLRMFHAVGARYLTLTLATETLAWADSGTDKPKSGGHSEFGEEVVREMNRLGMLVDLSHTSPDTMLDAIRVSEPPVIFSHSDARALNDHGRNVPDDVLRLLPKTTAGS